MAGISLLMIFIILLSLAGLALWIWALADIIKSDFKDGATKIVWLIIVIAFSFPGTLLYLMFGRETKKKSMPESE